MASVQIRRSSFQVVFPQPLLPGLSSMEISKGRELLPELLLEQKVAGRSVWKNITARARLEVHLGDCFCLLLRE